ncbi:MAG: 3-phosphoshikimate 1-carboxyvinyltransferase [Syntrophales bacterium]|jgi:3-phosphoshikimate 1-carboxyvinyltransferase|nr:3-phosphoshikimate 1-carboxyvinyltransferase [Syntrophales bacterium]MCK9527385.1 3-phosphoshikimate 1-carboxyvinyltransferase [Syntrophales bacterium]MDX9921487.1 3-phosphoshikimate 1-carboxyvinyltransferase [Syntrophales bacterium]
MKQISKLENLDAVLVLPGSKSWTQRVLAAATLARGVSRLRHCLRSEDTDLLSEGLRALGAGIETAGDETIITGTGGRLTGAGRPLFMGNNGTGARFLLSLASLAEGPTVIDGDGRLRERPMKPLLRALDILGARCDSIGSDDYLPVVVHGGGIGGGKVVFRDSESSQYVSSLFMAAPRASGMVTIELAGRILSRPYIDMTLQVMSHFGVCAEEEEGDEGPRFRIAGRQDYRARDCLVEGDASGASYFFIAAALCRGRVRVTNIGAGSGQGDLGILDLLRDLGCRVARGDGYIEVEGRPLAGGARTWDLSSMPDMVPGLAVLAAFRPGQTIIANVPHLRYKESDRLAAMAAGLTKTGIRVRELPDGLVIEGGSPRGAAVSTYNDHRLAMSFAVAGLATGDMIIENGDCVGKSFPTFWTVLEGLYR